MCWYEHIKKKCSMMAKAPVVRRIISYQVPSKGRMSDLSPWDIDGPNSCLPFEAAQQIGVSRQKKTRETEDRLL